MDEEERFQIFPCSFLGSWENLVMAITIGILKMDDVNCSLLFEEMRRKVSLNAKEALSV